MGLQLDSFIFINLSPDFRFYRTLKCLFQMSKIIFILESSRADLITSVIIIKRMTDNVGMLIDRPKSAEADCGRSRPTSDTAART